MGIRAIVGANWGDEGKGKMTDVFAGQADMVIRFQGGGNAGHTIINEYGKFALHLLPSGVFRRGVTNVIGPGVAVDIRLLMSELRELVARGVPEPSLVVSDRAQAVLPYHILFDECEEERLGASSFGSTKSGIAPFYSDKYAKIGIQLGELHDEARLRRRLSDTLEVKNLLLTQLYGRPALQLEPLLQELLDAAKAIRPFLGDTGSLVRAAIREGKNILLEGQLGALRDVDHGIYPYSTSSSPLAGFAPVGAGVPPHMITDVVAVVKAYSSCVGAGPFVTELEGAAAEELRRRGGDAGEYGAKTGRPRRVGWFDAVATRYGCAVQGATSVALTLVDVLGYLDEIPVCVAYDVRGRRVTGFPLTSELEDAKPVWEMMPGWRCGISAKTGFHGLPLQAQRYIRKVEELIEAPVRWASVGPHRDDVIEVPPR